MLDQDMEVEDVDTKAEGEIAAGEAACSLHKVSRMMLPL